MNKAAILVTGTLWLITVYQLSAQSLLPDESNPGFLFITEVGFLKGTGNVTIEDNQLSNQGVGARMRFIAGYYITRQLSVGLGAGFDGYFDPNATTFPIFIDVRSYLKDARSTPFASLDLGYAPAISDRLEKGFLVNLAVGYKVYLGIFGRKSHLLPSLGFNLQQIKRNRQTINSQFPPQLETIEDSFLVNSLVIGLGVEF